MNHPLPQRTTLRDVESEKVVVRVHLGCGVGRAQVEGSSASRRRASIGVIWWCEERSEWSWGARKRIQSGFRRWWALEQFSTSSEKVVLGCGVGRAQVEGSSASRRRASIGVIWWCEERSEWSWGARKRLQSGYRRWLELEQFSTSSDAPRWCEWYLSVL